MSILKMKQQSTTFDELYTPKEAVLPILKYLKPNSLIWCPFDKKESEYVKVLTDNHFNVIYTHSDYNEDFFEMNIPNCDYIISNPPYSIKDKVLKRLYELNKPFMMLLPITALEGKIRNQLYKTHGVQLLVLNKRIDFTGKGANYFNTSYFCWKVLPKDIMFAEIEKDFTEVAIKEKK